MKNHTKRYFQVLLCILLFLCVLCSCGKVPEHETTNSGSNSSVIESTTNTGDYKSKFLQVYTNGNHSFSLWSYDKEKETMILLFDESKVVYSYFVFEEMNSEETVTLYNGTDKDCNWKIQVSYNNIEDVYMIYFGDEENLLLFDGEDFSGEYSYLEEKDITLKKTDIEKPLSFDVVEREDHDPQNNNYVSRANGIWHHTISRTDTQTLKILEDKTFELYYISVGEVKESVYGTYSILSDDGKYQEFLFESSDKNWTAKIWQTELKDNSDVAYDGIVYINDKNETIYYTGQKYS